MNKSYEWFCVFPKSHFNVLLKRKLKMLLSTVFGLALHQHLFFLFVNYFSPTLQSFSVCCAFIII